MLRHLIESIPEEVDEMKRLAREVKLCALLHDVGHGPFSHSFERVLKLVAEIQDPPLHEEWTHLLITNDHSELNKALKANDLNADRMGSVFKKSSSEHFPKYLKQIVSSQIDVDRMDYLVRDSHFAGVAVGKFDIQYLINSLVVIRHGGNGSKTLGLTQKGVKAYEAFALARQLMNRTVYYHRKIKVLEYMMEQFIREVLLNASFLHKSRTIGPLMPEYFASVAKLVSGKQKYDKTEFMLDNLDAYIALTEDTVWTLLSAVAKENGKLGKATPAKMLAERLLSRHVLPNHPIEPGRGDLLKEGLIKEGMETDKDFSVFEVETTAYKATDDDKVFVVDQDGEIDEILAHSELMSALRDKPEHEALLVIINNDKRSEIESIANDMQAIPSTNGKGKKRSRRVII